MTQVQTLPIAVPLPGRSRYTDIVDSPSYGLVENLLSSPTSLHLTGASSLSSNEEHIFPSLPALQRGHPDVHLRNGIMNATHLASEGEPDAEKAFFVADLSQVYKQHQRWLACLPEIQPHYAVKCNPDPYVLRLLASLGSGFDCASNNEISQVLSVGGIDPSRIIFANPCKATSFVRNAAKMGVDLMTFDNQDELYKMARANPHAKCVVRILTDDSKSLCQLGLKFGATLSSVHGLLEKAKELKLDVVGVAFHVGSGCYDPTVYADAISRARAAFDIAKEVGYTFSLLDVGGGFEDALFEQAATVLNAAIAEHFPRRENLKIIAEPGRFYVDNAFRLATNIIARRAPLDKAPPHRASAPSSSSDNAPSTDADDVASPSVMYYINDGVYGAFNCIMFDHQKVYPYPLSMAGSFHIPPGGFTAKASVWGPTCDSIDLVSESAELPEGMQIGDWLGFNNMGAYTVCAASRFNGFEVSKVVYTSGVESVEAMEVRKALRSLAARGHGLL